MTAPYKLCPNCQNASPMDAAQCVRCGHVFRPQFTPRPRPPAFEKKRTQGLGGTSLREFKIAAWLLGVAVVLALLGSLFRSGDDGDPWAKPPTARYTVERLDLQTGALDRVRSYANLDEAKAAADWYAQQNRQPDVEISVSDWAGDNAPLSVYESETSAVSPLSPIRVQQAPPPSDYPAGWTKPARDRYTLDTIDPATGVIQRMRSYTDQQQARADADRYAERSQGRLFFVCDWSSDDPPHSIHEIGSPIPTTT